MTLSCEHCRVTVHITNNSEESTTRNTERSLCYITATGQSTLHNTRCIFDHCTMLTSSYRQLVLTARIHLSHLVTCNHEVHDLITQFLTRHSFTRLRISSHHHQTKNITRYTLHACSDRRRSILSQSAQ